MTIAKLLGSIVLLAACVATAPAGGYPSMSPCYPATWTIVYPATACYVPAVTLIVTPAKPLVTPKSMPPAKVEMPPAEKAVRVSPGARPTVVESRTQTAESGSLSKDRCRVGFWNLTGRDVTLVVDGQTRVLPRDRAVTLELGREFAWHIDERAARTERVAGDKSTYEVVIR